MPIYRFEAIDNFGRLVKEELEAQSLEEFFSFLDRKELVLIKYSVKKRDLSFLKNRITRKELAEFLHNLAFMIKSGIPLISALEDLCEEIKNPKLSRKLRKILIDLESGISFSEAVEKVNIFSPIVVALIRIGEESGRLDKTLEEASKHIYRIDEIISQTKKALVYPSFVLLSMSIAFMVWFFYVLPQLTQIFKSMKIKLPTLTLWLIAFSEFLKSYVLWIFLSIGLAVAGIYFFYKNKKTQVYIEKFFLKIPLFNRVKKISFLAFFFEFFSLLLNSGVDLIRSLEIMETSFFTELPRRVINTIQTKILEGSTISEAMREIPIFKRLDIRIVSVGEASGRLPEQLKFLADFYYTEVKELVDNLTKIIEPVLLLVSGFIFLVIILSLLTPVYELISKIGLS